MCWQQSFDGFLRVNTADTFLLSVLSDEDQLYFCVVTLENFWNLDLDSSVGTPAGIFLLKGESQRL